ncbi:hypothetical protein DL770_009401 [Monosporascus sp. CRB-9-2]|nr:hypothetical protein DL770_009401 [Monosporascus sp. CRB-9-2]
MLVPFVHSSPTLRSGRVVSFAAARQRAEAAENQAWMAWLRAMNEGGPMAVYLAYLRAHNVRIRAEEREQRAS